MSQVIVIVLDLDSLGKPRATQFKDSRGNHRAFHKSNYVIWRHDAEKTLLEHWQLPKQEQIERLTCWFVGCDRSSDADNSAGSVMDAAVKAGLIAGDTFKRIPWLVSRWLPGYKGDEPKIIVRIKTTDKALPKYLPRPKAKKAGRKQKKSEVLA